MIKKILYPILFLWAPFTNSFSRHDLKYFLENFKCRAHKCDLSYAQFDHLNLEKANFANAFLSHASFKGAHLKKANFTHAHLHHADFSTAKIEDTLFKGADLSYVYFTNASLKNTSFNATARRKTSVQYSYFKESFLENIDFKHADLKGSFFDHTRLYHVDLSTASLNDVYFKNIASKNLKLPLRLPETVTHDFNHKKISPSFKKKPINAPFDLSVLEVLKRGIYTNGMVSSRFSNK